MITYPVADPLSDAPSVPPPLPASGGALRVWSFSRLAARALARACSSCFCTSGESKYRASASRSIRLSDSLSPPERSEANSLMSSLIWSVTLDLTTAPLVRRPLGFDILMDHSGLQWFARRQERSELTTWGQMCHKSLSIWDIFLTPRWEITREAFAVYLRLSPRARGQLIHMNRVSMARKALSSQTSLGLRFIASRWRFAAASIGP
jgi:hypothetical protein